MRISPADRGAAADGMPRMLRCVLRRLVEGGGAAMARAYPTPGWRCPKCGAVYAEYDVKPGEHWCLMREDDLSDLERVTLWKCGACRDTYATREQAEACHWDVD